MAAPITTTTTAEQVAEVLQLDRARKRAPTADEVLEEYERATEGAERAYERDFGPAVWRTLLADLATWPAAFQRRVGDTIEWHRSESEHHRAEWYWSRFAEGRREGAYEDSPVYGQRGHCGCGCRGFNSHVAHWLRLLRETAAEAREARAKSVHAVRSRAVLRQRRERIANYKGELLELLWLHGQRRIDRARLRQHAAEHARAELADLRRCIAKAPRQMREARDRLRENRTYNRRGPTDRPLSPQRRLEFEREIAETKKRIPQWRARAAEFEALLADPHAIARRFLGCERVRAAEGG